MEDTGQHLNLVRGSLITFATNILKNNEDAQEVVQEVFQECLHYKVTELTRPFLFKAVRNRSLNKIRSQKRFINAIERFTDYLFYHSNNTSENESAILNNVDYLPQKQREVLVLRIKEELKISEIAEILDVPEGTIKSRLNKALKSLRENIKGI